MITLNGIYLTELIADAKIIISQFMAGLKGELARGQVVQHHGRVEQDLDVRLHAQVAAQAITHFGTGMEIKLKLGYDRIDDKLLVMQKK